MDLFDKTHLSDASLQLQNPYGIRVVSYNLWLTRNIWQTHLYILKPQSKQIHVMVSKAKDSIRIPKTARTHLQEWEKLHHIEAILRIYPITMSRFLH